LNACLDVAVLHLTSPLNPAAIEDAVPAMGTGSEAMAPGTGMPSADPQT
jgi:hypothetical protein